MPLLADSFACVKTGMLPTGEVVSEVARLFRDTDLPAPVVDPVIMSSSGQRLMAEEALAILIGELLPLARLVTPNIPEAIRLTGIQIASEADMREAAAAIRGLGARAVLIKGGHLTSKDSLDESEEAIDVLDNCGQVTVFRHRRVPNVTLHGTGCMLSAAIAAGLGRGVTLEDSVGAAKQFVWDAIQSG
jgi:hydroxymethylpyrimidine kinase/phosphomethylpyrimidine kinase